MTLPSSPKKVVVLALPGARALDLASVLDVFTLANWQLAPNPAYQVEVVTSDAKGRVTGMTGLQLVGNVPYFACTGEIDTLLIAGGVSLVRSGNGKTGCLVAQDLALLTKVRTLIHEEISGSLLRL